MRLYNILIIFVVLIVVLSGVLTAFLTGRLLIRSLDESLVEKGKIISRSVSELIGRSVIEGEEVYSREVLKRVVDQTKELDYIFVIGFDNRIFAHSFDKGIPRGLIKIVPEENIAYIDHEHYLLGNKPIVNVRNPLLDGMSANVNVGLDESFLYSQLRSLEYQILGIVGVVLIIGITIGILFSRFISRPISQLTQSLSAFGDGKVKEIIRPPWRSFEISELISSFNTMAAKRNTAEKRLEQARKEIEAWNRELEKRVAKKTEELEKSQLQLIQSEKLSAMGQMAGGLAHELNSPLAGLLPMLEQYRSKSKEGTKEQHELSLMLKAAQHMARVIKDFGVFSRKSKCEFQVLGINEAIEDTLSFSAVRLKQKGIEVIKELSYKEALVFGDKTELQQVILNMLSNASDSMPEGGRFIVRTDTSYSNGKVVMEFIDHGAGIEKENIDKVFDPFFTTKKEGEGTGLGLSVSYRIIERHKGTISVESEPGKGTRFKILLPAAEV